MSYTHEYKLRDPFDHIRSKYGITKEDWEEILESQGGVCAICKKETDRFHVDHDHKTNEVRGLVCTKCNYGLHFVDDDEWISAAKQYLQTCHRIKIIKHPDRRYGMRCVDPSHEIGVNNRGHRFCRTCANKKRRVWWG